jgi:hypothetical protein
MLHGGSALDGVWELPRGDEWLAGGVARKARDDALVTPRVEVQEKLFSDLGCIRGSFDKDSQELM